MSMELFARQKNMSFLHAMNQEPLKVAFSYNDTEGAFALDNLDRSDRYSQAGFFGESFKSAEASYKGRHIALQDEEIAAVKTVIEAYLKETKGISFEEELRRNAVFLNNYAAQIDMEKQKEFAENVISRMQICNSASNADGLYMHSIKMENSWGYYMMCRNSDISENTHDKAWWNENIRNQPTQMILMTDKDMNFNPETDFVLAVKNEQKLYPMQLNEYEAGLLKEKVQDYLKENPAVIFEEKLPEKEQQRNSEDKNKAAHESGHTETSPENTKSGDKSRLEVEL